MKRLNINWFEAIYWSIIAVCVLGALVGCEQKPNHPATPDSSIVPHMRIPDGTPPGATVEFEATIDGGLRKSTETASGTGAGLTTSSDEAAAKFATSAPGVTLPGMTGTGGDSAADFSVRTLRGAAGSPLLWVGIVGVVAGLAAFYFGLKRAATFLLLGGGGFIVAAMLPGWAWAIIAAVGLAGAGVYLWSEWDAKRLGRTAKAVVAGVDDLKRMDPVTYERAKAAVATHARSIENGTITQIKRKIAKERV